MTLHEIHDQLVDIVKLNKSVVGRVQTLVQSEKFLLALKRSLDGEGSHSPSAIFHMVKLSRYAEICEMIKQTLSEHEYQDTKELRMRCKNSGIQYYSSMTKEEMIEALEGLD